MLRKKFFYILGKTMLMINGRWSLPRLVGTRLNEAYRKIYSISSVKLFCLLRKITEVTNSKFLLLILPRFCTYFPFQTAVFVGEGATPLIVLGCFRRYSYSEGRVHHCLTTSSRLIKNYNDISNTKLDAFLLQLLLEQ